MSDQSNPTQFDYSGIRDAGIKDIDEAVILIKAASILRANTKDDTLKGLLKVAENKAAHGAAAIRFVSGAGDLS